MAYSLLSVRMRALPVWFQSPEEEGEAEGWEGEGGEKGAEARGQQRAPQALRPDGVGAGGRRLCGALLPSACRPRRRRDPQAEAEPATGRHTAGPAGLPEPEAGHDAGEEGEPWWSLHRVGGGSLKGP